MWAEYFLVAAVGGLIALDRTVAFQVMISRPIVAGPIIGLLLGQPLTGAAVGALLELVWISRLPLGGHIPPNESLGAILAAGGASLAAEPGPASHSVIALTILLVLPLANLASHLELRIRQFKVHMVEWALSAAEAGRLRRISAYNLVGLALSFVFNLFFLLLTLALLTTAVKALHPILTPPMLSALDLMYYLIPLAGVAAALSTITVSKSGWAYGVLFLGALVLLTI